MFTDTKRAVLTTSPGNFLRQAEFFSLNVRKIQKNYLKIFSKSFYGHMATAVSTTLPGNFCQKAKTFARCQKNMEKKRKFLNIFFLIMCLWPRKMKFSPTCKNVFCQKTEKFLLRCEIDWKIRTLISRFFSKILWDTQKSNSFNSVEKFFPEDDNFLLNVQNWLIKKICLKKLFPCKMCLRTQGEQFWQIRRETFNDRQSFFLLNVRKIQKKKI